MGFMAVKVKRMKGRPMTRWVALFGAEGVGFNLEIVAYRPRSN